MQIEPHIGLVLEGGGMRGVFTSGVLDYFMDAEIRFAYCVAVSAGACNGLSYMSRQRGRAKATNIDLLEKYRYIGMKYLWTQRSILDRQTLYDDIPNTILPFDYEACFANPMVFEMVTVNCRTGLPCYLTETASPERLITVAKASSSLPFVCPIVEVDGEPMLDGGIIDSIPVERAMLTGHSFNIVVTTRNKGYRDTGRDIKLPRYFYSAYPRLRLALSKRHVAYNRQLRLLETLEEQRRVLVIRPKRPLEVERMTEDVKKLTLLYEEGRQCAREAMEGFFNQAIPVRNTQ